MKISVVALLAIQCILHRCTATSEDQLTALRALYDAAGGVDWDWATGDEAGPVWSFDARNQRDPCADNITTGEPVAWQAVACSLSPAECAAASYPGCDVTELNLDGYQLVGSIPPEIGGLSHLVRLDFQDNSLGGAIPSELGLLSELEVLYLNFNCLSHSLPTELGMLQKLQFLLGNANMLTGEIPTEVGALTELALLLLSDNALSGPIPAEIGSMSKLINIKLNGNCLDGSIPVQVGRLSKLVYLFLENNLLTGSIPTSIAGVSSLGYLHAHENSLTGPIPSEIGFLSKLIRLSCYLNFLSGPVPSTIGSLSRLSILYLSSNCITGSIPKEIGKMSSLEFIYLNENRLTGTIPAEIGSLADLATMIISDNIIGGSIPKTIATMSSLSKLSCQQNFITSTLPTEIGMIESIEHIDFMDNMLTGSIPAEIGLLSKLESFLLHNNMLTGTIPSVIGLLTNLDLIHFYDNSLTGSIPSSVGSLTKLYYFDVDTNLLTGEIPPAMGSLSRIATLYLNNNLFSGTIPSSLGLICALETLELRDNSLHGVIPSELAALSGLQFMYLSNNFLTGSIPLHLFEGMNELITVELRENYLTGTLPGNLVQLPSLLTVSVNNNAFTGQLPKASTQIALTTVDFSDNFFSGPVPGDFFLIPNLRTFAATRNCFTGELPDLVCNASGLVALLIDGASSAECHNKRFLTASRNLQGTVPSCVFSMPSLASLHLSGNGLFGSLGAVSNQSRLLDITLSRNHLTGTIPQSIIELSLMTLDMSYNRITGTVASYEAPSRQILYRSVDSNLQLKVNRLSGDIPRNVESVGSLDILVGNAFACNADRSDLPSNDDNERRAVCGSNDLDRSLYVILGIVVIIVFVVLFVISRAGSLMDISGIKSRFDNTFNFQRHLERYVESLPLLVYFFGLLTWTVKVACVLGVTATLVLIVLYVSLDGVYSTHTYSYAWFPTATFISGVTPSVCILVLWVGLVLLFYVLSRRWWLRSPVVHLNHDISQSDSSVLTCNSLAYMRRNYRIFFFIITNAAVVLCSYGVYVYLLVFVVDDDAALPIQAALVAVLFGWNSFIAASSTDLNLLFWLYLFNNIIAPCVASMVVDPTCFRDAVISPNDITANYVIERCILFQISEEDGNVCTTYFPETVSVSYSPSFIYNFQCGSSTLRNFAPVILLSYSFSLVMSVTLMLAIHSDIEVKLPGMYVQWLPRLCRTRVTEWKSRNVEAMAVVGVRLAVIISLGVVCPYIALVGAGSAVAIWGRVSMQLTAFMSRSATDADELPALMKLENSCANLTAVAPFDLWLGSAVISALTLGIFLMDMAADDDTLSIGELFLFPAAALLSVLVIFCVDAYLHWLSRQGIYGESESSILMNSKQNSSMTSSDDAAGFGISLKEIS